MENMSIDFEIYEDNVEDLTLIYQEVSFHIIFDINIEDNFLPKAQVVSGGYNTKIPYSITYSSVVSW